MLEHMAFKGTDTRSARDIAEEIEAVGGFLNAYTSREQTAFHARVLKDDVPLALDMLADILTNPTFEAGGTGARAPGGAAGDRARRATRPTTSSSIICNRRSIRTSRWAGRSWATRRPSPPFTRDDLRTYMGANYRAGGMTLSPRARSIMPRSSRWRKKNSPACTQGGAPAPAPAHYVGGDTREADDLEQAHIAFAFPGVSSADPDFYRGAGLCHRAGRRHVLAPVPGSAREARPLLFDLCLRQAFEDSGMIGIYAGTGEDEAGEISP